RHPDAPGGTAAAAHPMTRNPIGFRHVLNGTIRKPRKGENEMKKLLASLSAVAMLSVAVAAWSATPKLIPYQGRLTDAAGAPINGSRDIGLAPYNGGGGGSPLFSETPTVNITHGLFDVNHREPTPRRVTHHVSARRGPLRG